jgi:Zn-dependent protease
LHEYGHALTARRYGVKTKDIIISPIGGMARLMNIPEKPMQEFWVAIMGPAVNVVIALLLAGIIYIAGLPWLPEGTPATFFNSWENMFSLLMGINIGLVIFNLVPAFPMDGGRILRSLLSLRLKRLTATRIATYIGQGLAVLFIAFGVYHSEYILPFIGVFVFMTASYEFRSVKQLSKTEDATAEQLVRPFTPIYLHDRFDRVLEIYKLGKESNFLILDASFQAVGIITEDTIENIKQRDLRSGWVATEMSLHFKAIQHELPLRDIITLVNENQYALLPVFRGKHLIGVIDRNDIENYLVA